MSLYLLNVFNKSKVMITWSRFTRMKFQPVQSRQISLHGYMGKLNFIQASRDNVPPGICLDLYTFYFSFSLRVCQFTETHQGVFYKKKLFLRILQYSQKYLCYIKFIKKRLRRRFSCECCKIFKNTYFE